MIRTQLMLTPTLYETLKIIAQREGKSLSGVVRDALTQVFAKKKRPGKEILQAMLHDAVYNPKAPRDLSTNDDYLYGKKVRV